MLKHSLQPPFSLSGSLLCALCSMIFWVPLLLSPLAKASATSEATAVIRPAPDVTWLQRGHLEHLSSLRGSPVLLLISPSPRAGAFRRQLHELRDVYEHLAEKKLVCLAAFTQEEGVIPSNIPFITVAHGAEVAAAYDLRKGSAVILIGADGNLDCLSTHVLPGQRVDDLIDASYTTQERLRRP